MKNHCWRQVGQVEFYAPDDETAKAAAESLVWADLDDLLCMLYSGQAGAVRLGGREVRFRRVADEFAATTLSPG